MHLRPPLLHRLLLLQVRRKYVARSVHTHHVCVIGSGPAGFYAAQHLLKLRASTSTPLNLDIFEKLPVPFGLVRYGVAPDHPEVKNVTNTFNGVLRNPSVRFVGNIEAGTHVSFSQLVNAYHAIILCYGATSDRLLSIPNESLVTSAREFVGWYNGLPANSNLPVNLSNARSALIIGHGNVALDIARILLTPPSDLESTDIAPYALDELRRSAIKQVVIAGRRGLLQVAFTIKEFREMLKLTDVGWNVISEEKFGEDIISGLSRPKKRLAELILKSASEPRTSTSKHWVLKFLRSPLSLERSSDNNRLAVKFMVNRLEGERAVPTDITETVTCDLVFRSIGYKGKRVFTELPFDEDAGIIPNVGGRVQNGIYCCGWAGVGPRGVILSTMQNSFDVAKLVSADLETTTGSEEKQGFSSLDISHRVTSYSDYLKIAEEEHRTGNKITDVAEMMRICNGKS